MQAAIFFDRDGILNQEIGDYVTKLEDFKLLPDAGECIKIAKENGFKVFVITNQGGIAKQLYSKETLHSFHQIIQNACGNLVDEFFYCPHHHTVGNCICRKPDSLMVEKAIAKYKIDKTKSIMFGDTPRDVEAAEKAGIKGVLVQPNSNKIHLLKELISSIQNN